MNSREAIDLLTLAVTYGIPAVKELLETWTKDEVTLEDIEALLRDIKEPEEY